MQQANERGRFLSLFIHNQTLQIVYDDSGLPNISSNMDKPTPCLLFLHGWACDLTIFDGLREKLADVGRQVALDFPGFGQSDRPKQTWGVDEYADFVNAFIQALGLAPCVCIGHSFGGRAALRLAHRHPESVKALVLIAGAGLKRRVPFWRRMKVKTIRQSARLAQAVLPFGWGERVKQALYNKIGSRDYKSAGAMRPILVKVVNDDLREILPEIAHPTLLIYGSEDRETPPEAGRLMAQRLPNSHYVELPGFDHLNVLGDGRHQVEHQIRTFLKSLEKA